jgi:acetyl-CoA carboxylase alpha subunit
MCALRVPIIATVIGEGGSGGALALGVADRVMMMENAVYSVISVEGCAAILWKDGKSPETRERAANALRITAHDLYELRVIDEIIPSRRRRARRPAAAARRPPRGAREASSTSSGATSPTSTCGAAGRSTSAWCSFTE